MAKALQTLQQHAEEVEAIVAVLLSDMENGDEPELMERFGYSLHDVIGAMDVYGEATSAFHLIEDDWVTLAVQDFRFAGNDNAYDFTVVQIGRNKVVIQMDVCVRAEAECQYSHAIWDLIDKEYILLGSSEAKTEVEFDAVILVTFEGDFSSAPPSVGTLDLELIEAIESVDFGQVDIDYRDDRHHDDYE